MDKNFDEESVVASHAAKVADTAQLTREGALLIRVLQQAKTSSAARDMHFSGKTLHVPSVGRAISRAYERLRNSTEYTDDTLLLQRAIRRYLRRNLFIENRTSDPQLIEEMIVELTHAGYLVNDAVTLAQIDELKRWVATLHGTYQQMVDKKVPPVVAQNWILDVLSVECEWVLDDPSYLFAFVHFAHDHVYGATKEERKNDDVAFAFYLAILKQLLKADRAAMRAVVMEIYHFEITPEAFMRFNIKFDQMLEGEDLKQANNMVNRRGAPLRILRTAFFENTDQDSAVISDPSQLRQVVDRAIAESYGRAEHRLNRGIVKSLVFLVITKVIVGIAIEVPVDYWLYGSIIWLPLIINLLMPPLLMVGQRFTLRVPGERNSAALQDYIADMLYEHKNAEAYWSVRSLSVKRSSARIFSVVYSALVIVMFGAVVMALRDLGFNIIQGFIFFVFLSTASFLGFRLSRIIRDLELVRTDQNLLGALRDFIYMPFIFLGRWLSGKYAQFNVLSILLDYVIELPLKTVLRHIRQWIRFLDERKASLD